MFCPRCGKSVNDNANFCGGCGLPKQEIERLSSQKVQDYSAPVFEPAPTQNAKIENFVEQPFPTDVEFKDISDDNNTVSDKKEPTFEDLPNYNVDSYTQAQNGYTAASQGYTQPMSEDPEDLNDEGLKEEPLATVEFVWMMVFSAIPIIGWFYLIWLGFIQDNNTTKRSYARASLIMWLFGLMVIAMFAFGFIAANMIF